MYCIHSDDYEQTAINLNEQNIIRYPSNIGLTGLAIQKKELITSSKGFKDIRFATEVDNYINCSKISSVLIGPMLDKNGSIKGVIQLINKQGDGKISEQDEIELQALLPALGNHQL